MFTLEQILNKARAEIGVKETGENYVKYNDAYWGKGVGGSDYPWCVVFLWWVFRDSGVKFPDTAHCDGVRAYARNAGRWVTDHYQTGDCVVFDYDANGSGDHIGIVESVNADGTLTTIEGNYSDSVTRVVRRTDGISGAYRPIYGSSLSEIPTASAAVCESCQAEPSTVTTVNVSLPMLTVGSSGDCVFALQALLIAWGYSCGECGTDGDFGTMTRNAVTAFQRDFGLEADGIVGALTWGALLERR